MNQHLHVLHLFGNTLDDDINRIADIRLGRLIRELNAQGITDYTIVPGFFDKVNTKQAIQMGHKKIVKEAKSKGLPNCIIAEDDIVFSNPCSYKYFLSQLPQFYDLFLGLIYAGEVNLENRILNGMSGTMTLYSVHERFYDFFLSQPDDAHVDRNLGQFAYKYEYYVCHPQVCFQRGGYSYNLKKSMEYSAFMRDKDYYGRPKGEVYHDGQWQVDL